MEGTVWGIYTCARKGQPMRTKSKIKAFAGVGLEGDRYALGTGLYSGKGEKIRHVTLFSVDDFVEANKHPGTDFEPNETRRNILVYGKGFDLVKLIDSEFMVGEVRMMGTEVCEPCKWPSTVTKKVGFLNGFAGIRGGIRARILTSGLIKIGDWIYTLPDPPEEIDVG